MKVAVELKGEPQTIFFEWSVLANIYKPTTTTTTTALKRVSFIYLWDSHGLTRRKLVCKQKSRSVLKQLGKGNKHTHTGVLGGRTKSQMWVRGLTAVKNFNRHKPTLGACLRDCVCACVSLCTAIQTITRPVSRAHGRVWMSVSYCHLLTECGTALPSPTRGCTVGKYSSTHSLYVRETAREDWGQEKLNMYWWEREVIKGKKINSLSDWLFSLPRQNSIEICYVFSSVAQRSIFDGLQLFKFL